MKVGLIVEDVSVLDGLSHLINGVKERITLVLYQANMIHIGWHQLFDHTNNTYA